MATVNPYLSFNGNCEDAFKFYKSIFGGEFGYIGRYKDMPIEQPIPESVREKIMHISLPIGGDTVLMGADSSEFFGVVTKFGDNISLYIDTENAEDAKRIFKTLSEEGTIIMPLEKTFWSTLFGHVIDKFGIYWMISYD